MYEKRVYIAKKDARLLHIQPHFHLANYLSMYSVHNPKCRRNVEEETLMDHFEYIHAIEPSSRSGIEAAWGKC